MIQRGNESEMPEGTEQTAESKPKKAYEPPAIKGTEIVPDEVLMGACKSSGGTGPVNTCDAASCFQISS